MFRFNITLTFGAQLFDCLPVKCVPFPCSMPRPKDVRMGEPPTDVASVCNFIK
jgi:hypothetical protein